MTRVQIVEKENLNRKLLAHYIDCMEEIEIVSECRTCEQALQQLDSARPDVVIMETNTPDADILQASEIIHRKSPSTGMVVISSSRFDVVMHKLQQSGVRGFLSSDDDPADILEAIASIVKAETYMSRTVAQQLALATSPAGSENQPVNLSEREKEVLILLGAGKSVQEIADTLYLSPKTVFSHRKRIFEKTGAKNSVELLLWALRNQFLDIG